MFIPRRSIGASEPLKSAPTLVDLCVKLAIINIRHIGDVGDTDLQLLERILPHCNVDQLSHIENSTEGRDLSQLTNLIWKRLYKQHYGEDSLNLAIKRMNQNQVVFKWRKLFEAKTKERELAQQEGLNRLRQLYAKEVDKKRSRQIKICSKIPPSGGRRNFNGGSSYNLSGVKSNIMKKARLEYLQSPEVKIHAAIRRNELQKRSLASQSVSRSTKPSSSIGSSSISSFKPAKPLARR